MKVETRSFSIIFLTKEIMILSIVSSLLVPMKKLNWQKYCLKEVYLLFIFIYYLLFIIYYYLYLFIYYLFILILILFFIFYFLVNVKNVSKFLPYSCYLGDMEVINKLVEKGANSWNWSLEKACEAGNYQVAKFLIERGANVAGEPLAFAALSGNRELIDLLISHGLLFIFYILFLYFLFYFYLFIFYFIFIFFFFIFFFFFFIFFFFFLIYKKRYLCSYYSCEPHILGFLVSNRNCLSKNPKILFKVQKINQKKILKKINNQFLN